MKLIFPILFCIFIGEIAGIDPSVNGVALTPSFLSISAPLNSAIMGNRIEYQKGEKIGGCTFIKESNPKIRSNGYKRRCALFECKCGNEFEAQISNVKLGKTNSCGCYKSLRVSESRTTHGLRDHPLYNTWADIKKRCSNHSAKAYKDYGGRGITVCNEWRNDFKAFYDYVMGLENAMRPGLTIDRIRNNEGYKPENLRWATRHIQRINQRKRKDNISGYMGISYDKRNHKWCSIITVNNNSIWLGYHETIEPAINARNQYILDHNLMEYEIQKIS